MRVGACGGDARGSPKQRRRRVTELAHARTRQRRCASAEPRAGHARSGAEGRAHGVGAERGDARGGAGGVTRRAGRGWGRGGTAAAQAGPGARRHRAAGRERATWRHRLRARVRDPRGLLRVPRRRWAPGRPAGAARPRGWRGERLGGGWMRVGPDLRAG